MKPPAHIDTSMGAALLRREMEQAGLTQLELARRAGVDPSEVCRLLKPGSNPTVGTLARYLACFGKELVIDHEPLDAPPRTGRPAPSGLFWKLDGPGCVWIGGALPEDGSHELVLGA